MKTLPLIAFHWSTLLLSLYATGILASTTERVSVASDGTQGNGWSYNPAISADGRYVAFRSYASNLVSGDSNARDDIFVHDRDSGTTERVSIASDGTQGNAWSFNPAISADGRYVAFYSHANNLVSGDTNGHADIFVHDRDNGTTERVSVTSDGTQGNAWSFNPAISADGRYVAFFSYASNLVSGDSNGDYDIFVHDRDSGITERVSVASDGTQGNGRSVFPSISADGRYVAFFSHANNLVSGDSNGSEDIFVHDRDSGITERVSVASDGTQGNSWSVTPAISADGRYVAFRSYASNLVSGDSNARYDIFVHDRNSGTTERVSVASDGTQGNGWSVNPAISADGRYVAFRSHANNLVSGDSNGSEDIFLHDRDSGTTERVSVASDGTQGNAWSYNPAISADGRYVAFTSYASNLVSGDTNGHNDIFVHSRNTPPDLGELMVTADPIPLGSLVYLEASVTEPDSGDSLTAHVEWGDGTNSDYSPSLTSGEGTLSGTHNYSEPGIYTVNVTLTDEAGSSDTASYNYVVVYDPSAGFVTGGGWIDSPAGAYTANPSLTGNANFGFVAKYRKGQTIPDGNTQFHFSAGELNFHSTSYKWLVVSGSKAQFKGEGQINNSGEYGFLLTATDGAVNGGGGMDKFRIKIWNKTTEMVVYDNQPGESDDANVSTSLGGGSIVIHTGKGK